MCAQSPSISPAAIRMVRAHYLPHRRRTAGDRSSGTYPRERHKQRARALVEAFPALAVEKILSAGEYIGEDKAGVACSSEWRTSRTGGKHEKHK
jgi:hypothetical protein